MNEFWNGLIFRCSEASVALQHRDTNHDSGGILLAAIVAAAETACDPRFTLRSPHSGLGLSLHSHSHGSRHRLSADTSSGQRRDGLWSGEMSRFGASHGCDWEPRLAPKRLSTRFYLIKNPSRRCPSGAKILGQLITLQLPSTSCHSTATALP